MWLWGTLLVIVAAMAILVLVVQRRRGPSDTGGTTDFNVTNRSGVEHHGDIHGPTSSGGGGA